MEIEIPSEIVLQALSCTHFIDKDEIYTNGCYNESLTEVKKSANIISMTCMPFRSYYQKPSQASIIPISKLDYWASNRY